MRMSSRLDFYLIGMENIWVSLPLDQAPDYFPHGSDAIVVGEIVRDSDEDRENRLYPYIFGPNMYILLNKE